MSGKLLVHAAPLTDAEIVPFVLLLLPLPLLLLQLAAASKMTEEIAIKALTH
jgi:hypothetical protein